MDKLRKYELTLVNYNTGHHFHTVAWANGELEAANDTADKYEMPVVGVRLVMENVFN